MGFLVDGCNKGKKRKKREAHRWCLGVNGSRSNQKHRLGTREASSILWSIATHISTFTKTNRKMR